MEYVIKGGAKKMESLQKSVPTDDASKKSVLYQKIDLQSSPSLQEGTRKINSFNHLTREANDVPKAAEKLFDWFFLNSQEPFRDYKYASNILYLQQMAPHNNFITKLMKILKTGPNLRGTNYRDPLKTQLATLYASDLISSKLIRKDGTCLISPESWLDIEALIESSTEIIATGGHYLADSLQIGGSCAKILALFLETELSGINLTSTEDALTSFTSMPTVAILESHGFLSVLKFATVRITKCIIRLAQWLDIPPVLSSGNYQPNHFERCADEANTIVESLGSFSAHVAWLYCNQEKIAIDDQKVVNTIANSFLEEIFELDTPRQISTRRQFLKSISVKEFAVDLSTRVGAKIGMEDELKFLGLL